MAINYVKFLRGTPTAFEKLSNKDSNTLYFISEKDADYGLLYLGDKLISGGKSSEEVSVFTKLSELSDVLLNEVSAGDFLVYENGKWVNKSRADVASIILDSVTDGMVGASELEDGAAGLVPGPKAGDQNKFLRGDGSWAEVPGMLTEEELEELSDLSTTVSKLVGEDDADKTIREIAVEALSALLIPEDAKESLDTLEEIADWIQKHPDDIATLNTTVNTLEEKVSDFDSILNDTVDEETEETIPGLVTRVGNLEAALNTLDLSGLEAQVEQNKNDIEIIKEALVWQEMSDEDGSVITE